MRRLLVGIVVFAACGWGPSRAGPEELAFRQAEAAATSEVNRHWAELTRAAAMDAIGPELARHRAAMAPALAELERCLEPVVTCGARPATMMDEIGSVEAAHETALADLGDLDAVAAEADDYARAAGDALHALVERWDRCL